MPDQFSVIRNAATRSVAGVLDERPVETGVARKLIVDRQFLVLGDEIFDAAPLVNPRNSGIIVPGAYSRSRLRRLKDQFRSTPLIMEPTSVEHYSATAENPFDIPQEEGTLFRRTLDNVLDDQRASFSDLALTPTGQIAKGDSRALKAALDAVNALDRRDVLFVLPMLAGWLDDDQLCRQIVAVINRSRHPVALAFVSTSNPVGSLKRLKAYRRIMEQVTQMVVAYRVDLVGFDARAHGAVASATGPLPSRRRVTTAGKGGQANDPTDLAPHMLIGDMLRYARSKHMRRDWFVDTDSLICNCPFCAGLPIDRLYEGDADRRIGHLHGVVELGRLNDMTLGLDPEQFRIWWISMAKGAVDIYPRLSTYLGKNVPVPVDVEFWSAP